jgi:hypothetical protein
MLSLAFALTAALAVQDPVVRIVARDFAFEVPQTIPGPMVRLRVENAGHEPHYMRFLRINGDHSLEDFARWRQTGGPLPQWLRGAGGPGTIGAGESFEFSAQLEPGRYIIMCGHPSPDGIQHVDKGMYRMVTVTSKGEFAASMATATFLLSEHAIEVFGELRKGEWQYLIANAGRATHQALVVLLPDGVTAARELDWFRQGSLGVRPGHPMGGAIEVRPGDQARVMLNLKPGRYILFCSIRAADRRHFDLGMMLPFEIR